MPSTTLPGGTVKLADDLILTRMGYGAMQLAGPHVFGPPKDHDGAIAVLREVIRLGINHIDTSDFYGPHITNQLIKEALHPYPEQSRIVTKVGARRDAEGNWPKALAPDELREAVDDNLTNIPLGGFTPLRSETLSNVAARLNAKPMSVALAWLLQRSPNILLIPGTSSVEHLRENVAGAGLQLPHEAIKELNAIAG